MDTYPSCESHICQWVGRVIPKIGIANNVRQSVMLCGGAAAVPCSAHPGEGIAQTKRSAKTLAWSRDNQRGMGPGDIRSMPSPEEAKPRTR
jgi:hypothetical protein